MRSIVNFIKKELVFFIAFATAAATMFFVKPNPAYINYIDFRVLAILFCLMAVISGFRSLRLFDMLSQYLLGKTRQLRLIALALVMMCFFISMVATNDVALLAFIPFTIMLFPAKDYPKELILIVTLQTIAANLGSMLTPVGNPQNLYLYSAYNIPAGEFFSLTWPVTLLSLLLLVPSVLFIRNGVMDVRFDTPAKVSDKPRLAMYLALFILSMLSVFRVIHYAVTFSAVFICLLLFDRRQFKGIDYSLLATFICFFIFVGNIANIDAISNSISRIIKGREMASAILLSQVISNVPAAVLLSSFTSQYTPLLLGSDIGGLGTLVASLASLISFKYYARTPGSKQGKYFLIFTLTNVIFIMILILFANYIY